MQNLFSLGSDNIKTVFLALTEFYLIFVAFLIVLFFAIYIPMRVKKSEKLNKFLKFSLFFAVGSAITFSAIILFLQITRTAIKGEITADFYFMLGFFAVAVASFIAVYFKKTVYALLFVSAYGVALLVFLTGDGEYSPLNAFGMYLFTALHVVVTVALTVLFGGKEDKAQNSTRPLAYAGICLALSYALSFVKIFSLPLGGSVTLASMLPLMIYAYAFGSKRGILAGIIYGILQCLQSPQIYQPVQVLLDYPIAFGCIGLAGIGKEMKFLPDKPLVKFVIGSVIAVLMRYFAHVISGYFVFYSWSVYDNALLYSFVYNLFCIADYVLPLIVAVFLFKSKRTSAFLTGKVSY